MSSTNDNELLNEIMNYMNNHNCTLITTLDRPAKRHIIEYVCGCGKTRKQKIGLSTVNKNPTKIQKV